MATVEANSETAYLSTWVPTYTEARNNLVADLLGDPGEPQFQAGQYYQTGPPVFYGCFRGSMAFDISSISTTSVIIAATLRIYGHSDQSDDDFDVTIVTGPDTGGGALDYDDFDEWGLTSFGSLNTLGMDDSGWNTFTINAAGLEFLNSSLQTDWIFLGIRSGEDIASIPPPADTAQRFRFENSSGSNPPELVLTISNWPGFEYPTVPLFPLAGLIDLGTYSEIKHYMEGLDSDLSLIADSNGNVGLAVANYIWWTGTSEVLGYDNSTSHVTVTTLESTSSLTLDCDLVTADSSVTTTGTAVDSTVANDALLSNTAHASIKAKITDNEIALSAISAPSPADDEADIYMDSTSGDLVIKTRDDGQAGVKTDLLGDFSGM